MGKVHDGGARTGRRQNPASGDTRSPHATFHSGVVLLPDPPQLTLQQANPAAQQLPVIDPAPVAPMQLPAGGAGDAPKAMTLAVGPTREDALLEFPSVGAIPSSDRQEQSDPSRVGPPLSPVKYESQVATNPSVAATNTTPVAPTNTVPNPLSNTVSNDVANSAPGVVADDVPGLVPVIVSGVAQGDVPSAASGPSEPQQPRPEATPTVVAGTPAKGISGTVAVPHVALAEVPTALQNSASSLSANVSSDAAPAPTSHGHVAKGDVAEKSNSVSASQLNPAISPPTPETPATVPSVSDATVDQLVALIQPAGALLVTTPAHALDLSQAAVEKPSDVGGTDRNGGLSNSINEVAGLQQHVPSGSAEASSQPVSQDTSPSGDQSQGGPSQQGQKAATTQANFSNHNFAAVDHTQNPGFAVLSQTAPAPAGVSDQAAKASQPAAPPTVVVPQAVPVINTARLIQSMGQSEMRVGMRSNDFGNISISTSATRDMISARISLDHGELARTLATHLPEMQAKFAGNQAMNVRIDTNGPPDGQSAGTSASMSNGSASQSRSDPQQRGGGTSRESGKGFAGESNSIPGAVSSLIENRLEARLDIRV